MAELHLEVHYGVDLAADAAPLADLGAALVDLGFGSTARVLGYERDRTAVDVDLGTPAQLQRAVVEKGSSRGPVFDALATESPPTHARRFGDVMLRGGPAKTWLPLRFDEYRPAMPIGGQWCFSNSISMNTERPRVGAHAAHEFIRALLHRLVPNDDVLWGAAWDVEEFHALNLHDDADGMWALGRDMRRALPGVFWCNAFGSPYVNLIGREVLLSAPAASVEEVGSTIVVESYATPDTWATEAARDARSQLLNHIGRRYFYDRTAPDLETVAPDFGLPDLPPPGDAFSVVTSDGKTFTVLPTSEA